MKYPNKLLKQMVKVKMSCQNQMDKTMSPDETIVSFYEELCRTILLMQLNNDKERARHE